MIRTFDPTLVDRIINHASVRPTAEQGGHALSSAAALEDPRNYALIAPEGLVLFQEGQPLHFIGHIFVLAGFRGAPAIAMGNTALTVLFGRYDALECRAEVPLQLRAARWLVRRLGFVSLGADSSEGVEHFIMEAARWHYLTR